MGNGYDEWSLNFNFLLLFSGLGFCGITFDFWAGLCGQLEGRREVGHRPEGKSRTKIVSQNRHTSRWSKCMCDFA